jgi:hypothetical protein
MTMKTWRMTGAALLAGAVAVVPVGADVWDVGTPNDNTVASQNELLHGSRQTHDLGALPGPAADVDWYRIGQPPYSSWEVTVEGISANASFAVILEQVDTNGITVLQTAPSVSSLNFARSLRFQNPTGTAQANQYVRVRNTTCGTTCTANEIYHLRAYDTTYSVSRFNNTGTQSTVLLVQNTATYDVGGTVYFWRANGTLLASAPLAVSPSTKIPAKQLLVLHTTALTGAESGSITIVNDGRYGDLVGKAVSVETATGFAFDTQMVPRP